MEGLIRALGFGGSKPDYAEKIPETLTAKDFCISEVSWLMKNWFRRAMGLPGRCGLALRLLLTCVYIRGKGCNLEKNAKMV